MKKTTLLLLTLTLLCVVLITYSNHFHNSFHFDDEHTIINNTNIRDLKKFPSFFTDATTSSTLPANQSYRPIITTSLAIDFYLSGKTLPDPFVFHITNFISFLLIGLLCYFLFIHFLQISQVSSYNSIIAFFTTAWFLLHAANAETVNYIIARSDIMSTLFMIAGFILYIYLPRSRKFYLYMIPVILGLLVKEVAVMFVPLLFFYILFCEKNLAVTDWWKQKSQFMAAVKAVIIPFIIIVSIFLFTRTLVPQSWTPGGTDRMKYIFTQPSVVFHYLYNFILPANLVVDTDWTVIGHYTDDRVFAGLLFIAALITLIVITSRKASTRPIAFGITWFLVSLAPTSLMPFAEVLNDHRTFLPYIGLFIASATLIRNFLLSRNIQSNASLKWLSIITCVIFLSLHAYATHERNKIWSTEETLWKEASVKAPTNGRAWMNYGNTQMQKGDFATAQACFQKTIQLWPYYSRAYINMAIVKQYTGDAVTAESYFKKALTMDPSVPGAYIYYGKFLLQQRRTAEAEILVKKGLELSPNHEDILALATAIRNTTPATQTATTPESLLNLSLQYYNTGDFQKCIEAAEDALKLNPDYVPAYNNICAAYNKLQQYDKAIEAGKKGLQLNPNNQLLKNNLNESIRLKSGGK